MNVQDYLKQVAEVKPSHIAPFEDTPDQKHPDCYYSKFDGSYITMVGVEDNIKYLAEREITDQLTHGVGFSLKDGKWYGWSHRAIYGFKIGSTCNKGDCHYQAANLDDEIEKAVSFWSDEFHAETTAEVINGKIEVSWTYNDLVPNVKLRGTTGGCGWSYDAESYGRGEWVAETIEDAKQMATDFNEGVS